MKLSLQEWNARQKLLRHDLEKGQNFQKAVTLFLEQHAMVHTSEMVECVYAPFADEIWNDITEKSVRRIPQSEDYSIVWVIWHMARIEDITMNLLVAGTSQLFNSENWMLRINSPIVDTGNAMDKDVVHQLSADVDISALREYRNAVGRRTREIVRDLSLVDLKRKMTVEDIQQVLDQDAVVEEAREIVNYWSKRTVAGLLLMPPTRHNMIHINQALRIKRRRI